jgi:hypothetical protein
MIEASELPDELQAGAGEAAPAKPSEQELAARYERLAALGRLIAGKRDAAVKARRDSGIEDVWTACEEAYAGIDEMNRTEVAGAGHGWRKPTSSSGPLTRAEQKAAEARSSVYVRLTTRYVDMAAAKVKEKALPVGGMPFSLEPSPQQQPVTNLQGDPLAAPAAPVTQAAPTAPTDIAGAAPAQPQAAPDPAEASRTAAKKAGQRIWDWMEEARFAKQIRRVIDDAARLGVGVLKGPFPKGTTERALSKRGDQALLEIVQRTYPGVEWVDAWNFFPAANCGEDVHEGDHVFELSHLAEAKLRALKDLREPGGLPIYLGEAIDHVIEQGPEKCNYEDGARREVSADKKGLYALWQYTGEMTREDMIALKALGAEELPDEVVYCNAIVTLVNDTVIRAQFNPLEKSGHLPYRVFPWSRRAGYWAGVGPGEQVAVPQRMVNAGTRAWMNNAGVSAGVQLVFDSSKLRPADNSLVIGGGIKIWETTAEGMGMDVRQLLAAIEIPNLGQELKAIVDFAFQLAEELSNIPLVTQGRDGPTSPQTFGQAELQNTNGNTLLRSIADALDSDIFEPLVDDYYELLLLDPDVPDEEKGDFQIIAKGCSAMVEKAIQEQTLLMMGQMTLNPAYGMSPEKWAQMFARAKRIDPDELTLTPQEKQARSQPQETPQEKVAKINAQTRLHEKDMDVQVRREIAANTHDRGVAYEQALASQDQIRLEMAREELQLKERLAMLDYANKRNITLDQVKAELAQTSMKLQAQREISRDNLAVTLHQHHTPAPAPDALTPPSEPAGRAEAGQAFSQ